MKKNTVGTIGHGRNGKRGIAERSRLKNRMREQVRRCWLYSIAAALLVPTAAMADATTGTVTRLYPNPDGRVYFWLANDSCKTNKYWYFDLGTEQASAWYSMLLAAAHNQTPVVIAHTTCIPTQHQVVSYVYQDF